MRLRTTTMFVACFCGLLASCSTIPAGDEGRLVARSPEQVIDVFAAAVNSGDIERVLAIYERNAGLAFRAGRMSVTMRFESTCRFCFRKSPL